MHDCNAGEKMVGAVRRERERPPALNERMLLWRIGRRGYIDGQLRCLTTATTVRAAAATLCELVGIFKRIIAVRRAVMYAGVTRRGRRNNVAAYACI
jgi:hypothetical protein